MPSKTHRKVQVFIVTLSGRGPLFLLLKQIDDRGGKWQPITGSVEEGEDLEAAARREIREETGITYLTELVDVGHSFDFFSKARGLIMHEHTFGGRVDDGVLITLSWEHSDYKWVSKTDALTRYLYWPENKDGFLAVCTRLGL